MRLQQRAADHAAVLRCDYRLLALQKFAHICPILAE
jgi:hypothetical protein